MPFNIKSSESSWDFWFLFLSLLLLLFLFCSFLHYIYLVNWLYWNVIHIINSSLINSTYADQTSFFFHIKSNAHCLLSAWIQNKRFLSRWQSSHIKFVAIFLLNCELSTIRIKKVKTKTSPKYSLKVIYKIAI